MQESEILKVVHGDFGNSESGLSNSGPLQNRLAVTTLLVLPTRSVANPVVWMLAETRSVV